MAPWKFAWPEWIFAPNASREIEAMPKAAPELPFDGSECDVEPDRASLRVVVIGLVDE
jgi:hypothetical protein